MDWQGALRARLLAAGPVTVLADQRVTWVDRPDTSTLPAITLQTITEARPQHFKGFDGMDSNTVQLDVWGESYGIVQALKEAAIAAVIPAETSNGIQFSRSYIGDIRDLGERVEAKFIHRASIDIIIHHAAA